MMRICTKCVILNESDSRNNLYIFLCTHFNDSSFQHDFLYDKLNIFKKCCKVFIISDSVEYNNFFFVVWFVVGDVVGDCERQGT